MAEKPIKLTIEQVTDQIEGDHPDWFITEDEQHIATGIEFENFTQAADFMQDLAKFADNLNHHPDVFIYEATFMQILIRTHEVDGFTEKDLEFINAFDEAFSAMDDDEDTADDIVEMDEEADDSEE